MQSLGSKSKTCTSVGNSALFSQDMCRTVRFAGGEEQRAWLTRMALRSGLRLAEEQTAESPSLWADFLVIDLRGQEGSAWLARSGTKVSALATACARLCVLVDLESLDEALALLDAPGTNFLCNPADNEIISELVLAGLGLGVARPFGMHDVARDQETVRLEKLSEEVRRLASTIERLTVSGDPANGSDAALRDRHTSFRGMPIDMVDRATPLARPWEKSVSVAVESGGTTPADIRNLIRARRMRDEYFSADLFADPAWDMLLDLLAARLAGQRVSVSSLCIAGAVPPTTALRWIRQLTDRDIFMRIADPLDGRRVFIALTDAASEALLAWVENVRRKGGLLAGGLR